MKTQYEVRVEQTEYDMDKLLYLFQCKCTVSFLVEEAIQRVETSLNKLKEEL